MIYHIPPEKILFIDIETVPQWSDYQDMPERFRVLWDKKAERIRRRDEDTAEMLFNSAGIYAEFGKVVCISSGFLANGELRIKSFYGDDEALLLKEFSYLLDTYYSRPDFLLCAHNGKEFDFPFLSRRLLINGLKLPQILDNAGKKPWEVPFLDTMELWRFGDYKNFTSLELLAAVFDIPTPKDDISGADIQQVYWKENDLERIVTYCQKDVITIVQLFLRYQNLPLLPEAQVKIIE
ncbi:MAG: 3'-5' exonuclease [Bacteroidales bacterium]